MNTACVQYMFMLCACVVFERNFLTFIYYQSSLLGHLLILYYCIYDASNVIIISISAILCAKYLVKLA